MRLENVVCGYDLAPDRNIGLDWSRLNKVLVPLAQSSLNGGPSYDGYLKIGVDYKENPRRIVVESCVLTREQIESAIQQVQDS